MPDDPLGAVYTDNPGYIAPSVPAIVPEPDWLAPWNLPVMTAPVSPPAPTPGDVMTIADASTVRTIDPWLILGPNSPADPNAFIGAHSAVPNIGPVAPPTPYYDTPLPVWQPALPPEQRSAPPSGYAGYQGELTYGDLHDDLTASGGNVQTPGTYTIPNIPPGSRLLPQDGGPGALALPSVVQGGANTIGTDLIRTLTNDLQPAINQNLGYPGTVQRDNSTLYLMLGIAALLFLRR